MKHYWFNARCERFSKRDHRVQLERDRISLIHRDNSNSYDNHCISTLKFMVFVDFTAEESVNALEFLDSLEDDDEF